MVTRKFALFLFLWFLMFSNFVHSASAEEDASLAKADMGFVQAVSRPDVKKLSSILDPDFTWTDWKGRTYSRTEILGSVPSSAANSSSAQIEQRLYGQVALVLAVSGKIHAARFWVRRSRGWSLLVYHEATLAEETRSGAPRPGECENPCKTLPYEPKNEAEKGIIASWQALETAVTNHESGIWAQHIADEFLLINSNNDHPFSKADRMAILDRQKQTQSPSAPIPLVSAQMFDFGDAVIMRANHRRENDAPVRVSRIWIKREGRWLMAFSEQTIVQ
jgi:hypothetical protein